VRQTLGTHDWVCSHYNPTIGTRRRASRLEHGDVKLFDLCLLIFNGVSGFVSFDSLDDYKSVISGGRNPFPGPA
jgi:hypothetical protein